MNDSCHASVIATRHLALNGDSCQKICKVRAGRYAEIDEWCGVPERRAAEFVSGRFGEGRYRFGKAGRERKFVDSVNALEGELMTA